MWLEIKSMMTVVGMVFVIIGVFIGAGGVSLASLLLVFMGLGLILMGDVIFGYMVTTSECKPLIDKTPPGYELTIFQEIGGGGRLHFINTRKDIKGQRKFRFHNKEAIAVTDGRGMFTTPNGNRGFFSHESYDKNIDPAKCKLYEKLEGEDIKEIFKTVIRRRKKKEMV